MISTPTRLLIGAALVSGSTLAAGSEPLTAASDRMQDGEKFYQAICASCHESGVDGAPVTGNKEDWDGRSHLWEAVLFEHADKGYINMPARGAADYATEYDVEVAAEYMLTITHPELPRD